MSVTPIPIFNDNYVWKMSSANNDNIIIVDPGCAKSVLAALKPNEKICAILVTHHHYDHIDGLTQLKAAFPDVRIYGPDTSKIIEVTHPVTEGDQIKITELNLSFNVIGVPGHTLEHVSFFSEPHLFCGDTLFSAGCGRMFEGTPEVFSHSLSKLLALPNSTLVYCAHEYTLANLAFAQHIEPDNTDIKDHIDKVEKLRANHLPSLPALLATEQKINPFLRTELKSMQERLTQLTQKPATTIAQTFGLLRQLKDNF